MKPGDRVTIKLPEEDEWTIFDVRRRDLPEVLVVNNSLRGFEHREVFPWHLSIRIIAENVASKGMPDPEEQVVLREIDEELEAALKETKTEFGGPNVLYFARSTWNGERELIFRVHDAETANSVLQGKIAEKEWSRPWDFRMEVDKEWELTAPISAMYRPN